MTTFVEKIEQSNQNPNDPRNREVVFPVFDPQGSNLATPINSSKLVQKLINNLPAYRQGLSPLRRGIEVGLAHGYWILGPFFEFNPLRFTDQGAIAALLSTISLIVISSLSIVLYAASNPPKPITTGTFSNPPDAFNNVKGWNTYATGFLLGGLSGAIFAFLIVTNFDVSKNFLNLASL
jgi:photosystem I subunit XI